ncbi:reverse [Lasius niger]|uniref:Reverse n=1 Tax=Lasius niger TaxID=67767 RepID=A0A0J7KSH9_LASNI|nr:reverse [Lasius niger]
MWRIEEDNWREFVSVSGNRDPWGDVHKVCMGKRGRVRLSGIKLVIVWKIARVTVLLKSPEKVKWDPGSYRPICPLSVLGKVLDRMMVKKLERLNSIHGGDAGVDGWTAVELGVREKSVDDCVKINVRFAEECCMFEPSLWLGYILTGHGSLNGFLYERGLFEYESCACGAECEDWKHVLVESPLYEDVRSLCEWGVIVREDGSVDVGQMLECKKRGEETGGELRHAEIPEERSTNAEGCRDPKLVVASVTKIRPVILTGTMGCPGGFVPQPSNWRWTRGGSGLNPHAG